MASIINADTSDGLKITSDTSGIIELQSGGVTKMTVNSSGVSGGGKILQVLSSTERGIITFTSALADALTINITPSSTSSKILVHWDTVFGRSLDDYGAIYLYKDGSVLTNAVNSSGTGNQINASNSVANRGSIAGDIYFTNQHSGTFLDSPSTTSAITYAIKAHCVYGSNIYLNAPEVTHNEAYVIRTISTLTVMEVGA